MNWRIINALVAKDFSLYFRNRFFALITVIGIVFYLIIYFVMPSAVNENLKIGLYAPVILPAFEEIKEEGLEIKVVDSVEALREAVIEGEYIAGIALPANIMDSITSGRKPVIDVYFAADTPEEVKDAVAVIIKELSYQQADQPLSIVISEEVLGPNTIGMPIPPRDRLRPLFAVLLVVFEMMGLANLISEEIERRTVQALLVTPMSVTELFIAKGIVGVSLAFSQALLYMAIAGGVNLQPLIVLIALLLGAIMATGIGFIIASLAKGDMLSVFSWGIPIFVILFIPLFGVIFPGTITGWVKIIPSYYLVDAVHRASNFGAGWGDVGLNLLILLGFDIVLTAVGIWALRRKSR